MASVRTSDDSLILRSTATGRMEMKCPHCEKWQDILAFRTLERKVKYGKALNTVVRCTACKHVFSPRWTNEES